MFENHNAQKGKLYITLIKRKYSEQLKDKVLWFKIVFIIRMLISAN